MYFLLQMKSSSIKGTILVIKLIILTPKRVNNIIQSIILYATKQCSVNNIDLIHMISI